MHPIKNVSTRVKNTLTGAVRRYFIAAARYFGGTKYQFERTNKVFYEGRIRFRREVKTFFCGSKRGYVRKWKRFRTETDSDLGVKPVKIALNFSGMTPKAEARKVSKYCSATLYTDTPGNFVCMSLVIGFLFAGVCILVMTK